MAFYRLFRSGRKKTNLALEKFRKSETIKEMLGLNFQPITLAHSHEKLSHSFPTNKNTKKHIHRSKYLKEKKIERVVFAYEPSVNSHCTTVSEKRCSSDTIGQQYL